MIPTYRLSNGAVLPSLCVGTNRMDRKLLDAVIPAAINAGFRFFDSAQAYGNEGLVGAALKGAMEASGLTRSEMFITTKVDNSGQVGRDMRRELDRSLRQLQMDYVDLWLQHWPYPGYFIDNFRQMADSLASGQIKSIGIANPRIRHLQELYETIGMLPHLIQIELHPFRQVPELLAFCKKHEIKVAAYSPLCFMVDRLKHNPLLVELGGKYGKSVGQIVLRWHLQRGVLPVFRSEKATRFAENANVFDFVIGEDDMNRIATLDEDYKFIPESLHCPGY